GGFYKKNKWVAIGLSSLVKAVVLYFLVKAAIGIVMVPEPAAKTMSLMFSWPQFITAAAGGILASLILRILTNTDKDM
ncbi:MAG TPA: hypothetical protein PKN88_07925, partial [Bacillota bacterium]|nr:hypothetical protein [Bacillota bacterium]